EQDARLGELLDEPTHLRVQLLVWRATAAVECHQEPHERTPSAAVERPPSARLEKKLLILSIDPALVRCVSRRRLSEQPANDVQESTMRKIIVAEFISTDGVVEAPERWHFPYINEEMFGVMWGTSAETDTMLLGRVTYQSYAGAFANAPADDPIAARMNR